MKKVKIGIVDYGMGNLYSLKNALNYISDVSVSFCSTSQEIDNSDIIMIPGVGAFGDAMKNLQKKKLLKSLDKNVLGLKKPTLGICLGMQMLFSSSEEGGNFEGLNWIPGKVKYIKTKKDLTIPHIGWNEIVPIKKTNFFEDSSADQSFYFVHSFCANCSKKYKLATVDYGVELTAAVKKENIIGVQFHPEKSQKNGLYFLEEFLNWAYLKC